MKGKPRLSLNGKWWGGPALFVALGGLLACAHQTRYLDAGGNLRDTWRGASDRTWVRGVGVGIAPPRITNLTQRMALARQAAEAAARRELLAVILGVRVTGTTEVSEAVVARDDIREVAAGLVAGAEEEQVEFNSRGECVAVLQVRRSLVEKALRQSVRGGRGAR